MKNDHYAALFNPVQFASVTAKNRVMMAPMVVNFASSDDEITDRQIKYFAERAKGGVGTIVVGASLINADERISIRQIGSYDDRFIPGLTRLASSIKSEGTVALQQLCHGGPKSLLTPGKSTQSVSSVAIRAGDLPQEMTKADLHNVRDQFVAAGRRLHKAGFDGVELHAAHFYLLSASISPYSNHRTDEYGGSVVNRTRLTREIIQEIKSSCGSGYVVGVRINACEALDGGLSLAEGQEVAGLLAEAGADTIHASAYTLPINRKISDTVTIGVGAIPLHDTPPGPFLEYAAAIKEAVNIPVIAVAKLDDPDLASKALIEGKCDMIALARQLICDPRWAQKVQNGQTEDIVRCKYCMICHTAQQRDEDVRCAQNKNLPGEAIYKKDNNK
jgi:2,4-dienoyl-CoA reductase-like NADH-dependent reductase (Old Yellow Enzyme family)